MRLLQIGAEPREFRGFLARASLGRAPRLGVAWARLARWRGHEFLLAANGAGMARAAAAVDACLEAWRADAVLSVGFCGAVDPGLRVADVVAATKVAGPDGEYPALPPPRPGSFRQGPIQTIARVARTAEEKRAWRAAGAVAVELEAAGVARRARESGLPFYCVRAVTDLAGEDLANDFQAALRPDGRFDTMTLLGSALRRPAARLPELLRLRRRCVRASLALGEFLAGCRF